MILQNPIYKGEYAWNRSERRRTLRSNNKKTFRRRDPSKKKENVRVREAPELRIVSPEMWEHVNSVWKTNAALSAAAKRRGCGPKFPLSGLLFCGLCNHTYEISGRDYYQCSHRNRPSAEDPTACRNVLKVKKHDIEEAVFEKFDTHVLSEDNIRIVKKHAEQLLKQMTASATVTRRKRREK